MHPEVAWHFAQQSAGDTFETLREKGILLCGTPDVMIERIRQLHERCNIGHLLMMNQAGFMEGESVRKSLSLFAKEVYPAIQDLGAKTGATA